MPIRQAGAIFIKQGEVMKIDENTPALKLPDGIDPEEAEAQCRKEHPEIWAEVDRLHETIEWLIKKMHDHSLFS